MSDDYELPISEKEELEIFIATTNGQALLCRKCKNPLPLNHTKLISEALDIQYILKSYVEPLKIKALLCQECFNGLYDRP